MAMSVTEASAAQFILQLAAGHIRQLRRNGYGVDSRVIDEDVDRSVTLTQMIAAGHVLAEQSYKKLNAGINGDRWDKLTGPDGDA